MNPDRPALVRALTAVAAVLFVGGVIGAFAVDSDDTDLAATRDSAATSTSIPGDPIATSTTAVEDVPVLGSTAPTSNASTTTPTTSPAPVPDPGPARAPAVGTYVYKLENSADPTLNGDTERKVEELPAENGALRRRQTAKDAQGNTQVDDVAWANDAIRVTVSRLSSGSATIECNWQPPLVMAKLPLRVGEAWKADSTCTTSVAGSQVTIRRVSESKVTGKVLDKVGDQSVASWVIESTGTVTVRSAFYNDDTKSTTKVHFAAARGLITRETGRIEAGARKGSYELVLQSLTPR